MDSSSITSIDEDTIIEYDADEDTELTEVDAPITQTHTRPRREAAKLNQFCQKKHRDQVRPQAQAQAETNPDPEQTTDKEKITSLEKKLKQTKKDLQQCQKELDNIKDEYRHVAKKNKDLHNDNTELRNTISQLQKKHIHIIMDSNRRSITPQLSQALPDYKITQEDPPIYTTDALLERLQTYKPTHTDTTTIIMMGTNDLKDGESKQCFDNFKKIKEKIPRNTLVTHIPYQRPHSSHPWDIQAHIHRRTDMNTQITELFNTIPLPDTDNNDELVIEDGIHLTDKGAKFITSHILQKIKTDKHTNPLLPTPPRKESHTHTNHPLLPTPSQTTRPPHQPTSSHTTRTTQQTPEKSLVFDIDNTYTGLVIGMKGNTIKDIQAQTHTTIAISNPTSIRHQSRIKITSHTQENNESAKTHILSMLESITPPKQKKPTIQEKTSTLHIKRRIVPHILGRGGRQKKEIEEKTGAQITTVERENGDMDFVLSGTREAVKEAKTHITDIEECRTQEHTEKQRRHHTTHTGHLSRRDRSRSPHRH